MVAVLAHCSAPLGAAWRCVAWRGVAGLAPLIHGPKNPAHDKGINLFDKKKEFAPETWWHATPPPYRPPSPLACWPLSGCLPRKSMRFSH